MDKHRFLLRRDTGICPFLLFVIVSMIKPVIADEHRAPLSERTVFQSSKTTALPGKHYFDWAFGWNGFSRLPIELPRRSRVTHSNLPLRQLTLVGGDRIVGELLDWSLETVTFQLLTGQTISVPAAFVAVLSNPPGEVDLFSESFTARSANPSITDSVRDVDRSDVAGGANPRRFISSTGFRREFEPQLVAGRIEFSFQAIVSDVSKPCGEWRLEFVNRGGRKMPITIDVSGDDRISVNGVPANVDATTQTLKLSRGLHELIVIVQSEQTRIIVDDSSLASLKIRNPSVQAIEVSAFEKNSGNDLRIDDFQVRSIAQFKPADLVIDPPTDRDLLRLNSGDDVFGRLNELTRTFVSIEAFGRKQSIPWTGVTALAWKQPSAPLQQVGRPKTGIAATIEMQPFVDRPECEPERFTATIVHVDADRLFAIHSVIGELSIPWSDIRRIVPQFFGQISLVDARQFHLGDSIRSDFHRQLADGTELQTDFRLHAIPRGQAFLSLEIAEVEAAGPTSPPGSPFLADLRAGRLVTEVFVNDHRIGNLNSLIRFKVTCQAPERVRLSIPRGFLKSGDNSIRLRQKPLRESSAEFDDCEVGNIRLEFDQAD